MADLVNEIPIQSSESNEIVDVETNYPYNHIEGEVHDSLGDLVPYYPINLGNNVTASLPKGDIDLGEAYVNEPIKKTFHITATVTKNVRLLTNYDEMTLSKTILTPEELQAGVDIDMTLVPQYDSSVKLYAPLVGFYDELMGLKVNFKVNVSGSRPAMELNIKPATINVAMLDNETNPVERNITVTGKNLIENLVLSCTSDKVVLAPTTITPDELKDGSSVKVVAKISADSVGAHQYVVTNNLNDFVTTINSTITAHPEFSVATTTLPDKILVGEVTESNVNVTAANLDKDVVFTITNPTNCTVTINDQDSVTFSKEESTATLKLKITPIAEGSMSFTVHEDYNNEDFDYSSVGYMAPILTFDQNQIELGTVESGVAITKEFNITSQYLTSDITLSSSDASVVLSRESIPAGNPQKTTKVTLTITPVAGEKSIEITNSLNSNKLTITYTGLNPGVKIYDSTQAYSAGAEVSFDGHTYRASADILPGYAPGDNNLMLGDSDLTLGDTPLVISSNWDLIN